MKLKSNIFIQAAALVALSFLAVWLISSHDAPNPDAVERKSHAPREKHTKELRRTLSSSRTEMPVHELSEDDLMGIYHRYGAADALAAAKSQPWPYRDNKVFFILTHVATENPEFVAVELKSSGLNRFLKHGLVDTILENWKDGRKALDWAENVLTGELRSKAVAGALGILVKSEPEAAFGYLENMPACEARSQAISGLFAAWGSHDPATALMRANELAPDEARSATEHVVRAWAKIDPEAAAAWVLETAPSDERWIAAVYRSWISISPDAKLWFDSLPDGDAKKDAATLTHNPSIIEMPVFSARPWPPDHSWTTKPVSERSDADLMHWAIQDTEGARDFVEQNQNDPASIQLSAQVAKAISGKYGPPEAMKWALRLPEENGNRDRALWVVFHDWSNKDPVAAGGTLASMPPDQYGKLPMILVNSWVIQDPAAAADWVAGWQGGNQTTMVGSVIRTWPNQDPHAAYQWLGTLPAGAGRDAGIRTMIHRERDSAPDSLEPWIDLISDPKLRAKTLHESERHITTDP